MFREIAFLKKLKNIPMWQGELFHSVVADYLRSVSQGTPSEPSTLLDLMNERARLQWESSSSLTHRTNPLVIYNNNGLVLYEHEYQQEPTEADCAGVIHSVEEEFYRFIAWAEDTDLLQSVTKAKKVWIEPPIFGPQATGFELGDVKALLKVDLALLNPNGKFEIYDWKTGQLPTLRSVEPTSQDEFQVAVYQLWPHLALNQPLGSIEAHLLYVRSNPVHRKSSCIDQNMLEYTLNLIRRSVDCILNFSNGHRTKELSINDFDFATYVAACRKCSFKRLCQRMLDA